MSTKPETTTGRFDVRSPDGTSIAVWTEGRGRPLVLVHGSIADHTTFDPFVAALRDQFTTYSLDRRGFGASGDAPVYAIERDFEDVAAVVDEVSERTGGPIALWGHSYGANCAMGAATLTRNVSHLVLYEPSLGLPYPPGAIDRVEAALAADDPDTAIDIVLVELLELSDEEMDGYRASPLWPTRLAAAGTIPRECRAEEDWVYEPGQFDAIDAATLFLTGSESVPDVRAATDLAVGAIPGAEVSVLQGHEHFAHKTEPAMVADVVSRSYRVDGVRGRWTGSSEKRFTNSTVPARTPPPPSRRSRPPSPERSRPDRP